MKDATYPALVMALSTFGPCVCWQALNKSGLSAASNGNTLFNSGSVGR